MLFLSQNRPMKQLTILVICCVISTTAFNQTSQQFSGGEYNMTPLDEMSPEQRATIFQMLEENEAKLQAVSSKNIYSEHGLDALIRPDWGHVCHSLMVVSNCKPGSAQDHAE